MTGKTGGEKTKKGVKLRQVFSPND